MAVLSPADIAEFEFLKSDLAYADPYRLVQTGPQSIHLQALARDAQGNRRTDSDVPAADRYGDVEIESGTCRLVGQARDARGLQVADAATWALTYILQMDSDSLVDANMRLHLGSRIFHVDGVTRSGELGVGLRVIAQERGR